MLNIPEFQNAKEPIRFFEEISKIPHISEHTEKIADYLVDFAKERNLWYSRDAANNVIIRKPATKGYENRPTVIFQGHTDMVADKVKGCSLDMENEGLKIFRDGDFIRADGTTLGGDDGVAIAYALAVLDSNEIEHPEFEALFTSDEEIGLIGATALDVSMLNGKVMINIDSDIEGIFTVGCAGGMRMDLELPIKKCCECDGLYSLSVSGLLGGHSGTEIDKGRINAIKVLAEILSSTEDVKIAEISGGNADNAIPRNAECVFSGKLCEKTVSDITEKYRVAEPGIKVAFEKANGKAHVFNIEDSKRIIATVLEVPSGVAAMCEDIPGLPETSSNLGIIKTEVDSVTVSVSLRSSKNSEKDKLRLKIRAIAEKFSAIVSERGEYPAWEYKKESHLREVMKTVYSDMYGKEPEIITIHAGLECGIFSNKIDGLDCVSIGPDNFDIHTPEERLSISSFARVWDYLKAVLARI